MHQSQNAIIPAATLSERWQMLTVGVTLVSAIGMFSAAPAAFAQDNDKRQKAAGGPGCAPDRPAIAHHAGAVKAAPGRGAKAPIPCIVKTGFRTSEIALVVTNAGSIVFQPALKVDSGLEIGVLRSVDQGAKWDFVLPATEPPRASALDQNFTVDRTTGRIFWIKPGSQPSRGSQKAGLAISDDDGKTWFRGGEPLSWDHPVIFTGPPTPKLKPLMKGYPNVVYACMDHHPLRCQKSLDGGVTWGQEMILPYPPELAPIQGPGKDCSMLAFFGVVGPDGTVYLGVGPCSRPYMAISKDEGETWTLSRIADTVITTWGTVAVGRDKPGNLYASYIAESDRLPYLAVSRDGGSQWSKPMMIAPPGVREAALPTLVSDGDGHVAMAYYGSTNAPLPFPPVCGVSKQGDKAPLPNPAFGCPGYEKERWNLYMTETRNAASPQPLFWSASLNDPAQPLWYGCSPSQIGVARLKGDFTRGAGFQIGCSPALGGPTGGGRQDYFGIAMAPDGTAWVGFGQACPDGRPVSGNPNCPGTLTGDPVDSLWGMVGRFIGGGEAYEKRDGDRAVHSPYPGRPSAPPLAPLKFPR